MSLKNENIGLAVGLAIAAVGLLLTSGNPSELEGALIAVLGVGSALWLSTYLNFRNGTFTPRREVRRRFRR
jgi:hypothetical protein